MSFLCGMSGITRNPGVHFCLNKTRGKGCLCRAYSDRGKLGNADPVRITDPHQSSRASGAKVLDRKASHAVVSFALPLIFWCVSATASAPFSALDQKILEEERAFAAVQRTAATQARYLPVNSRSLSVIHANNLVPCRAIRTFERCGLGSGHSLKIANSSG
jgi:hypothetical protein